MPIFMGDKWAGQNQDQPVFQKEYGFAEVYSFEDNVISAGWSSNKLTIAFSSVDIQNNGFGTTRPAIPADHDLYLWGWDIELWSRYGGTSVTDNHNDSVSIWDGSPSDTLSAPGTKLSEDHNIIYKTPSAANGAYQFN